MQEYIELCRSISNYVGVYRIMQEYIESWKGKKTTPRPVLETQALGGGGVYQNQKQNKNTTQNVLFRKFGQKCYPSGFFFVPLQQYGLSFSPGAWCRFYHFCFCGVCIWRITVFTFFCRYGSYGGPQVRGLRRHIRPHAIPQHSTVAVVVAVTATAAVSASEGNLPPSHTSDR